MSGGQVVSRRGFDSIALIVFGSACGVASYALVGWPGVTAWFTTMVLALLVVACMTFRVVRR